MDKPVVVSPDNMDDDTFAKHMNARHSDSLGGLSELRLRNADGLTIMWRTFHRKLHELRPATGHDHGDYSPVTDDAADEEPEAVPGR